jgi:hypothetical protein
MNAWSIVSHTVAISGRVSDARTDRAIAGAQVMITDGPPEFMAMLDLQSASHGRHWKDLRQRPDRRYSEQDGHFHFLDLSDGSYTLRATLPEKGSRFGTAQLSAVVSRDSFGHPIMTTVGLSLPPTTLAGRITDQSSGDPIVMAEVIIQGSHESAYSDRQGDYLLVGLEAGSRTMLVSAQGYQPVSQTVSLATAGTTLTRNVALISATP